MDKIIRKLKSSTNLTLILGLLSITWLIIDYFVVETVLVEGLTKYSLEWILLIASAIAIAAFHISTFITIYYSYRVYMRVKKDGKTKTDDTITEELIPTDEEN